MYANAVRSLFRLAAAVIVREGVQFRSLEFHSPDGRDGQTITANASIVLTNTVITLAD